MKKIEKEEMVIGSFALLGASFFAYIIYRNFKKEKIVNNSGSNLIAMGIRG